MGRKNKRKRTEYRDRLGFNPRKYITAGGSVGHASSANTHSIRTVQSNKSPHRGEIWFADLGDHPGTSVQDGCRPVLVVSNDIGNDHADTINVLPMTGHLKKPNLPCHTALRPEQVSDPHQTLNESMILAEQVTTISKAQLSNYVGRVNDAGLLSQIDHTICLQLGLERPRTQSQDQNKE